MAAAPPPSALALTAATTVVDRFGFFREGGAPEPPPSAAELLLEHRRTKKWLAMLAHWEPYVRRHPRQLKRRIRKGIPNSLRCRAWPLLCGATNLKAATPLLYQQMLRKTPARTDLTSIALDLPRTYPHHILFSPSGAAVHTAAQSLPTDASMSRGQKGLRDVLRAYACYDPRVGYCQGMAFVAGLLLSYMPAEDAFFMLVALMKDPLYGLSRMYAPALHQFHEVMHVFGQLVGAHLPRLAAHLAALGVEYVTFSSQWFITLFTYSFPFDLVTRAWDLFLSEGWKAVFRVAVAFLKLHEPALLAASTDEAVIEALKAFAVTARAASVIEVALRIPLPRAKLEAMLQSYRDEHGAEFAAREAFALADAARKEELQSRSADAAAAPQSAALLRAAGSVAVEAMLAPSPLYDGSDVSMLSGLSTGSSFAGSGPLSQGGASAASAVATASKGGEAGGDTSNAATLGSAMATTDAPGISAAPNDGEHERAKPMIQQRSQNNCTQSSIANIGGSVAVQVSSSDKEMPRGGLPSHGYAPVSALPLSLLDENPPPSAFLFFEALALPPGQEREGGGDGADCHPPPAAVLVHSAIESGVPVYLVTPEVEITLTVAHIDGVTSPDGTFADGDVRHAQAAQPRFSTTPHRVAGPLDFDAHPESQGRSRHREESGALASAVREALPAAADMSPADVAGLPDDYYRSGSESGNEASWDVRETAEGLTTSAVHAAGSLLAAAPRLGHSGRSVGSGVGSRESAPLAPSDAAAPVSVGAKRSAPRAVMAKPGAPAAAAARVRDTGRGVPQRAAAHRRGATSAARTAGVLPASPSDSGAASTASQSPRTEGVGRASVSSGFFGGSGGAAVAGDNSMPYSSPRSSPGGRQSQGGSASVSETVSTAGGASYSLRHQHLKRRAAAGAAVGGSRSGPRGGAGMSGSPPPQQQQQVSVSAAGARRASAGGSSTAAAHLQQHHQQQHPKQRRAPHPVVL